MHDTWFGKLKFFNFKQGRMIPYEVAFLVKLIKTRHRSKCIEMGHKLKDFGIHSTWQNYIM